jgi:hypothetical protein
VTTSSCCRGCSGVGDDTEPGVQFEGIGFAVIAANCRQMGAGFCSLQLKGGLRVFDRLRY